MLYSGPKLAGLATGTSTRPAPLGKGIRVGTGKARSSMGARLSTKKKPDSPMATHTAAMPQDTG